MLLLLDIGNTHTHVGLASLKSVRSQENVATDGWFSGTTQRQLSELGSKNRIEGVAFCSVVPKATSFCSVFAEQLGVPMVELNFRTIAGVGIEYPKPETIGADRLANAVAVKALFGAPALVVDFGTAVTFDVVSANEKYVGGIIAPGLSAMTDY